MIEIAVHGLAQAGAARLLAGDPQRVARGCVIDSRQVRDGSIFVAFPGERVDGNDFAERALEAGAACVVMTRMPDEALLARAAECGSAVLFVDDPQEFLLLVAAWWRERMDATVIGVTGSIGKTTTKDILAQILRRRYRVHVTGGNFNNLIGMPLTVLAAPADTEMLILEMGMSAFGEIERLSLCARPDFAVITKVGTSHIGMLGSREGIARAKGEIVAGMSATDPADGSSRSRLVLCAEDDFTPFIEREIAAPAGVEVLRVGRTEGADVTASDIRLAADGCPEFTVTFADGGAFATKLSVPGVQSVQNALFGIALGHELGIGAADIDAALRDLTVTGRRQEMRRARVGARIIDDSYNASPESMAAGLDLLCTLPCEGARVAVLGEMGEMGGEAPRLHALIGAYAAAKKLDRVVCVGGANAACMAEAVRMFGTPEDRVAVVEDHAAALALVEPVLGPSDLMLVKGSRFVGLDRVVEGLCSDAR